LLNAQQFAVEIANCDIGILCSGYGEGSPFIIVEALACGRGFILPPLEGLLEAYRGFHGIVFAAAHTVEAFVDALIKMDDAIKDGLSPEVVAHDVLNRSTSVAAQQVLQRLEADHH